MRSRRSVGWRSPRPRGYDADRQGPGARVEEPNRMRRPPLPTRLPRPPLRATAAFLCVLGVFGGAWLWLRDSSLVAVARVTVTGVSGPDAAAGARGARPMPPAT